MKKCKYCKDFNETKNLTEISEVKVDGGFYFYDCPIYYCPACGEELKLNIKVKDSIKYSFPVVVNIKGEKDVY